jgi:hypothetical protein
MVVYSSITAGKVEPESEIIIIICEFSLGGLPPRVFGRPKITAFADDN